MKTKHNPPDGPPGRPDPLIDEVRDIRRRLSESFGNDIDRLAEHLKRIEGERRARVIKAPARPGPARSNVA